jgi:multidrug efflux system outer membrane protein
MRIRNSMLDAQRQATQARQQLTSADTQVVTDLVSLYKALGGGWAGASD